METIQRVLSKSPSRFLYHYTSQDGLLGVVKSKTIWASKIQYLSDSQEFALALDLARRALERRQSAGLSSSETALVTEMTDDIKRMTDDIKGMTVDLEMTDYIQRKERVNICVCSFSEEGDLLSQWRAYCSPGPGFALGFKPGTLRSLADRQNFFLAQCVYDLKIQEQIVKELIEKTISDFSLEESKTNASGQESESIKKASWSFATKLATYAPLIKHPSFYPEKEWRLISHPICSSDAKFGYRRGHSMIIPFFKFDLVGSDGQFEIAEVIVGPTPHVELAREAVASLLKSHGVVGWIVRPCTAPYRTW
jgi:hypothetical protein